MAGAEFHVQHMSVGYVACGEQLSKTAVHAVKVMTLSSFQRRAEPHVDSAMAIPSGCKIKVVTMGDNLLDVPGGWLIVDMVW